MALRYESGLAWENTTHSYVSQIEDTVGNSKGNVGRRTAYCGTYGDGRGRGQFFDPMNGRKERQGITVRGEAILNPPQPCILHRSRCTHLIAGKIQAIINI
jgi:hypothetical protein